MYLLDIISYILGVGFSLVLGVVKIILVIILAVMAYIKGYNAWLWSGFNADITMASTYFYAYTDVLFAKEIS